MTNKYSKAACSNMPGQKLADGGTVGLWERLKAGNIDKEGSEANMRWGSGSKAAAAEPAPAPAAPAAAPAVSDATDESPAESARLSRQNDDSGDNYGNEDRRTASAPAPATPKRRTASAPAKSKTTAADASPSMAPSKGRGSDSRLAAAPAQAAKYQASANYGDRAEPQSDSASSPFVPGKSMFEKVGDAFRDFDQSMGRSPRSGQPKVFVNGGLIGAGTVNAVTKTEISNPSRADNALGGGRASYGKK